MRLRFITVFTHLFTRWWHLFHLYLHAIAYTGGVLSKPYCSSIHVNIIVLYQLELEIVVFYLNCYHKCNSVTYVVTMLLLMFCYYYGVMDFNFLLQFVSLILHCHYSFQRYSTYLFLCLSAIIPHRHSLLNLYWTWTLTISSDDVYFWWYFSNLSIWPTHKY